MLEAFAVALGLFTAAVLIHFVVTHVAHARAYVRNAYLTYIVVSLAAMPFVARLGALGFVFVFVSSTILWNLYLSFFINLMNSVSLRMMAEIDRAPAQRLSLTALQRIYPDENQLDARVEALLLNGFVQPNAQGELVLTAKGNLLARVLDTVRRGVGFETFG